MQTRSMHGEVTFYHYFRRSPAVMINGNLHGRVTPERFEALIAAGEKIK